MDSNHKALKLCITANQMNDFSKRIYCSGIVSNYTPSSVTVSEMKQDLFSLFNIQYVYLSYANCTNTIAVKLGFISVSTTWTVHKL